jgi:hypothetical protein
MLTHVDLSDSKIVAVGETAFAECRKLKSVKLNKECRLINHGAFQGCINLETINTENVMAIKEYAFAGTALTEIDLRNITYIGEETFLECKRLNKLHNAQKLKFIGPFAFDRAQCLVANKNTFESVEQVCRGAFRMCYSLDRIYLPKVQKIDAEAFVQSGAQEVYIGKEINSSEKLFYRKILFFIYFITVYLIILIVKS